MLVFAVFASLCAACVRSTPRQPPALSGITVAALDAAGQTDPVIAARTLLGPPLPVIGVRPGRPPRAGTLLWNEPTTGRIFITLARGRQSFTFHTTSWANPSSYVVALFFDGSRTPEFVVAVGSRLHPGQVVNPLGLDGELLPAQGVKRQTVLGGFEITLEELALPLDHLRLDLVGPWHLRPDNIADLVGSLVLNVRELGAMP
ncbi:hypothetical protein HRbin30_02111 [bacterium HR30]|nr:hypothetical protein HRbin30_02111 [bacterium HR30]